MATIVRTNSSSHVVAEDFETVKADLASGEDFVSLTELVYFDTPIENHNQLWIRVSQVVSVSPQVEVDIASIPTPEPTVLD